MKVLERRSRGTILIMSMIVLTVLSLIAYTCVALIKSLERDSIWQERRAQAFYLADSGVEHMLRKLGTNQTWSSMTGVALDSGTFNVYETTDAFPIVTATGYAQSLYLLGSAYRTIQVQIENPQIVQLSYGVQSDAGGIYLPGSSTTNSYDSTVSTNPVSFLSGGDIRTNGAIVISTHTGNPNWVNGTANYHSGTAPSLTYVKARAFVSWTALPYADGTIYASQNDDATGIQPSGDYNSAAQSLSVPSGSSATIESGVYYFQSISVAGTLYTNITNGPVVIYFLGNFDTMGNVVNLSSCPGNLFFYDQDDGQSVTLGGSAKFYGAVVAPNDTVNVNQEVYGAVVGYGVNFSSLGIVHFDTNLNQPLFYAVRQRDNTWRELSDRF